MHELVECSLTLRSNFLGRRNQRWAVVTHLLVDFAALHDTCEHLKVYVIISLPGHLSGGHVKRAGARWRVVDTYLLAHIKVGDESVRTLNWGVQRPRDGWKRAGTGDIGVLSQSLGAASATGLGRR
jgi:hypothetical protein